MCEWVFIRVCEWVFIPSYVTSSAPVGVTAARAMAVALVDGCRDNNS